MSSCSGSIAAPIWNPGNSSFNAGAVDGSGNVGGSLGGFCGGFCGGLLGGLFGGFGEPPPPPPPPQAPSAKQRTSTPSDARSVIILFMFAPDLSAVPYVQNGFFAAILPAPLGAFKRAPETLAKAPSAQRKTRIFCEEAGEICPLARLCATAYLF